MAPDSDPYRTLGLSRDATLDEVRRAYRRLAKANHPDAAGEAALPRFLAIQAAYDTIAGPDARAATAGRRATGGRSETTLGRRSRPRRRDLSSLRRPVRRARPSGGFGRRPRPVRAARPARHGRGGRRAGSAPPRPERPPNKATLGSTSYDGADAEPFEPDWGGASWYGTTSGHVLDAQSEGVRRPAQARAGVPGTCPPGAGRIGGEADEPRPGGIRRPTVVEAASAVDGRRRRSPRPRTAAMRRTARRPAERRPAPTTHTTSSWWEATAGHATRSETAASARPGPGRADDPAARPPRRAPASPSVPPARQPAGTAPVRLPAATPQPRPRHPAASAPPPVSPRTASSRRSAPGWTTTQPGTVGRIARAIVGWAPIALGIGWVGGEISGCGRFAAGCDDTVADVGLARADRGPA